MRRTTCRLAVVIMLCLGVLTNTSHARTENVLHVYPVPTEITKSQDFSVSVRPAEGSWRRLDSYSVDVNMRDPSRASMAYFDFTGSVEVAITFNRGKIHTARVRPLSYGIEPTIRGRTIHFSLGQPRNISIEVNGD